MASLTCCLVTVTVFPLCRHAALRRSANRLKRFQEKKAAEQATLPKSPAKEVVSAVRKEQETITVSSKDSCTDLESSNRSPSKRSSSEKQGPKHSDNQASEHLSVSLAEEQALLREFLEETDNDSDDDLEDTGDCAYCHHKPEKGVELKKCSRCRVFHYCSVNCKKTIGLFIALRVGWSLRELQPPNFDLMHNLRNSHL